MIMLLKLLSGTGSIPNTDALGVKHLGMSTCRCSRSKVERI